MSLLLLQGCSPGAPVEAPMNDATESRADGATAPIAEAAAPMVVPHLPLLRLELVFAMDEPVELPPFRGNLWRGVLGPALKRIDEGVLPGLSTGELERGTL